MITLDLLVVDSLEAALSSSTMAGHSTAKASFSHV